MWVCSGHRLQPFGTSATPRPRAGSRLGSPRAPLALVVCRGLPLLENHSKRTHLRGAPGCGPPKAFFRKSDASSLSKGRASHTWWRSHKRHTPRERVEASSWPILHSAQPTNTRRSGGRASERKPSLWPSQASPKTQAKRAAGCPMHPLPRWCARASPGLKIPPNLSSWGGEA